MRSSEHTVIALAALIGLLGACAPSSSRPPETGATITSEDLENPNEPIEAVLQRKVPGLLVTRTGDGGIALQIRSGGAFRGGDAPPLYILNGLPFLPGPGGALTGINPHEIESIKVLKPAESGLYGIDGANGVIVVTTKKPGNRSP
jgi:TonB-dependent SusC/RagA subfamily outer membrane receptor